MVRNDSLYLRNVIFGVADSLVSTVGLLAGIDASGSSTHFIVLTGIIYAFVESFSMAVGSFLSEQSAEEYETKGEISEAGPVTAGIVMFASFILASSIPIIPYLLFGLTAALWLSIGFSLVALLIVGMLSAKIVKVKMVSHAIKMMLLGGAAIIVGVVVGKFMKTQ